MKDPVSETELTHGMKIRHKLPSREASTASMIVSDLCIRVCVCLYPAEKRAHRHSIGIDGPVGELSLFHPCFVPKECQTASANTCQPTTNNTIHVSSVLRVWPGLGRALASKQEIHEP